MDDKQQQEQVSKAQVVQQCNFLFLFVLSCAAISCGTASTGYCAFLNRDVVVGTSTEHACASSSDVDLCKSFSESHAVGFHAWQGVVPENQVACLGYTLFIPNRGWVSLTLDNTFYAAVWMTFLADFFGMIAFFTLCFASCCPLDPGRMSGMSCYFLLATLFQGLTLLMFQSNVCEKGFFEPFYRGTDMQVVMENATVSCSLGHGANLAIAATVLYFVCMLIAPVARPPAPLVGQPHEQEALNQEANQQA